ncbi:MAG: tetraacyldisaccharide 4'-kinase [Candidatus Binatia bacterium]|nr:tetraacyldisaccharide 4'-kinase [Candidatus Binatia bacterium]MDG1957281.1 tetraacyldisaccharide 4'-kinase [Candidatus Binatia bacterium]MDG2011479.1 tetraacyldisaccharide 4'-kinase [Candidatus Binatia bacterium]
MRVDQESGLRERVLVGWRHRGALRVLLAPAALLFGLAVRLRGAAYRFGLFRTHAVDVPIVSIGNLTVGGTGKTPFALWLAERLCARGYRPAIVTRGYGGVLKGRVVMVGNGSELSEDVSEVGDEAVLLAERAGVPVVCGADRVAAAQKAASTNEVDLIVLDDGFQHRRLGRSMDIVLVDGRAGFGNGGLLPAGPLREPLAALRRADAVVVTKTREPGDVGARVSAAVPGVPVFTAGFAPAAVIHYEDGETMVRPLGTIVGRKIVTVSAIADPTSFYELLGDLEVQPIDVLEYPDHHDFDQADWQQISKVAHAADLIVCTEKDLVKLRRFPFARGRLVALRLELRMPPDEEADLLSLLARRTA